MDVSQYLEIFIEESKEHLQSLNDQLLILEREPENEDTINEIFRAAHSLKGMAGTMGYKRMQRLTHDMENVFSEVRNGKMKVSSELVDVLFKGLDALEEYLANIQADANEGTNDNEDIINSLNNILNKGLGKAPVESSADQKPTVLSATSIDTDKMKFKHIKIEDHEKKAIVKAGTLGMNVIGLTIYIHEYCVLKAARAYMVNRNLEEHGEIIKLFPTAQDIEDEKFDFHYSVFMVSKETPEKLAEVAESISEIKEVVADYISLSNEDVTNYTNVLKREETALASGAARTSETKNGSVQKKANKPVTNRSVRVDIEKLDVLMNLVSELIIAKNGLVSISSTSQVALEHGFSEQIEYLERVTTNLHESVMRVRMVPIESVVNRFPRMIRDLSKKLNKEMELYMSGEETELDRTVIDEIGDPLMHLLRNAADHGLESNEERQRLGKIRLVPSF